MNDFKERGGVRIGMTTATWPLVTLVVSRDKLEVNAGLIGNLLFRPQDIISIQEERGFGRGLRISHRVRTYRDTVVFLPFGGAQECLRKIERTGFLTNESPLSSTDEAAIVKAQESGARPMKTGAFVALAIVWNFSIGYDLIRVYNDSSVRIPGLGMFTALGTLFITCLLLLILPPFRELVLKEGRTLAHVKAFAIFIMVVTGLMGLMLTMFAVR
jgi:hypothetical protein